MTTAGGPGSGAPDLFARDALDAIELCDELGWTDGLPVAPPTRLRVETMLDEAGLRAEDVLGVVSVRRRTVTAEKVAANAVMAGCLPEHFPVVVAAVRALCEPAFNFHAVNCSEVGAALVVVVNGPIRAAAKVAAGRSAGGYGVRANAVIGRAAQLVGLNAMGGRDFLGAAFGGGRQHTACLAEDDDPVWRPLQVERGLESHDSAVTVFAAASEALAVEDARAQSGAILDAVRASLLGGPFFPFGSALIAFGPTHRGVLQREGWSKTALRQWLEETLHLSADAILEGHWFAARRRETVGGVPGLRTGDDALVVAAGGAGPGVSAVFAGCPFSRPVTRALVAHPWDRGLPTPNIARDTRLRIVNPTTTTEPERVILSPRLDSLVGARIGLFANGALRAGEFLEQLVASILERAKVGSVLQLAKSDWATTAELSLVEDFARDIDCAVIAIGDCAVSATVSFLDAVNCEKLGVPTVLVATEAQRRVLPPLVATWGVVGDLAVFVPHPIVSMAGESLARVARGAAAEVVARLLRPY